MCPGRAQGTLNRYRKRASSFNPSNVCVTSLVGRNSFLTFLCFFIERVAHAHGKTGPDRPDRTVCPSVYGRRETHPTAGRPDVLAHTARAAARPAPPRAGDRGGARRGPVSVVAVPGRRAWLSELGRFVEGPCRVVSHVPRAREAVGELRTIADDAI